MKPLRADIITIFPEMFPGYLDASILGRAKKNKLIDVRIHQLRKWTHDRHNTVDDKPFGGGPGMVMKMQPFHEALVSLGIRSKKTGKRTPKAKKTAVIMTAASGKSFTHADAVRLSKMDRVVFLCGRYEGVDHRVTERLADESFRIGDYVLTGGELPALVMLDAIARHRPGVLGKEASLDEESWSDQLTAHGSSPSATHPAVSRKPSAVSPGTGEYPQYTRPETYLGMKVPSVLLSGDHKKIAEWRRSKRV